MVSDSMDLNYGITNRARVNDLYSTLDSSYATSYLITRQLRVKQLKVFALQMLVP